MSQGEELVFKTPKRKNLLAKIRCELLQKVLSDFFCIFKA